MGINVQPVSDDFSVSSQLSPEDLAVLANSGVRSIINNRPDGEGGAGQPSDAQLRAAADAAGLFYAYLPVTPGTVNPRDAARMRALVGELPKPVVAFCRTGTRSRKLYHAAFPEVGNADSTIGDETVGKWNVGGVDRAVRIVVGAGLIAATLAGIAGPWGWLGVLPLATGVLRFCPAYLPFGLKTCR